MSSFFKTVQDTVVARLIASGVASGAVNVASTVPTEDDTLPTVNVYVLAGSGTRNSGNANHYDAEMVITLDCFETGATDQALADNVQELWSDALESVMTDHELAAMVTIKRYDIQTDLSAAGRDRLGGAQIKLTAEYINEYAFTFPNDLDGINVKVKHGDQEVDATIDMETT